MLKDVYKLWKHVGQKVWPQAQVIFQESVTNSIMYCQVIVALLRSDDGTAEVRKKEEDVLRRTDSGSGICPCRVWRNRQGTSPESPRKSFLRTRQRRFRSALSNAPWLRLQCELPSAPCASCARSTRVSDSWCDGRAPRSGTWPDALRTPCRVRWAKSHRQCVLSDCLRFLRATRTISNQFTHLKHLLLQRLKKLTRQR